MIEIASRPSAALSRERDLVVTNNGTVIYRTASELEAQFVALWIASREV